jgi:glutaryl-CoA transferase
MIAAQTRADLVFTERVQNSRAFMTNGPLFGITILDLSRVLAGPSCSQMLGDLGADVIKVERPGVGDETRTWGPPFVRDRDGRDTTESGYHLSTNRNKRSITVNFSKPAGAELVSRLLSRSDVLIENFKVGGLSEYGLGLTSCEKPFRGSFTARSQAMSRLGRMPPGRDTTLWLRTPAAS